MRLKGEGNRKEERENEEKFKDREQGKEMKKEIAKKNKSNQMRMANQIHN